jgi:hypothetical protein
VSSHPVAQAPGPSQGQVIATPKQLMNQSSLQKRVTRQFLAAEGPTTKWARRAALVKAGRWPYGGPSFTPSYRRLGGFGPQPWAIQPVGPTVPPP